MGAINKGGIYRALFEVLDEGFTEFLGQTDKPGEDLEYLWGAYAMTKRLIDTLDGDEKNGKV